MFAMCVSSTYRVRSVSESGPQEMMRCNVFFARSSLFDMNASQSVAQISEREIALEKEKKIHISL